VSGEGEEGGGVGLGYGGVLLVCCMNFHFLHAYMQSGARWLSARGQKCKTKIVMFCQMNE